MQKSLVFHVIAIQLVPLDPVHRLEVRVFVVKDLVVQNARNVLPAIKVKIVQNVHVIDVVPCLAENVSHIANVR